MVYISKNERETENIGEQLAKALHGGDVVAMRGGMGAGKTAFVRGLARGLGEESRVTSPTYTIVNEYETEPPLFHFDLYRLGSVDELFEIGFDDYLARGGICVIEWSENAGDDVVFSYIVEIEHDAENENQRRITISEA
ncbi:MAG: tRNA (adenosine(37)-N6)-threonylcarbamoyltransferase complex ATPase subunit type 1 TsaE [Oscillospiraceae bacterium]|nr:tRNA (adenosine(37)-N6)-threonylcarbamoyltransferase complex ATPase subunit type 1 TsaE [Oscillospiraceae bacterium]